MYPFLITVVVLAGAITGPAVGLLLVTVLAISFAVGFKILKCTFKSRFFNLVFNVPSVMLSLFFLVFA